MILKLQLAEHALPKQMTPSPFRETALRPSLPRRATIESPPHCHLLHTSRSILQHDEAEPRSTLISRLAKSGGTLLRIRRNMLLHRKCVPGQSFCVTDVPAPAAPPALRSAALYGDV